MRVGLAHRVALLLIIGLVACTDSESGDGTVGVEDVGADDVATDATTDGATDTPRIDASPDACDPLQPESCGEGLGCYVVVDDEGGFDGFACLPAGASQFACDAINDCKAGWQCFDAIGGRPHNDSPDGCKELCRAGVDPCSGECRSLCDAEISCDPALDDIGVCLFIGG